jgi:hypothetical protein
MARAKQPQQQAVHHPEAYSQAQYYSHEELNLPKIPPMTRSNDDLNFSVLTRYYPDVLTIISIAAYSVLYVFSPTTQQWEKEGTEGTLFVVHQQPDALGAERFGVIILNRRGMDNFSTALLSPEDVDVTDEYVILRVEGDDDAGPQIYGLWIFSEPAPSSTANARTINAHIIVECATRALSSRKLATELEAERLQDEEDNGHIEELEEDLNEAEGVPMGRTLSLRELFGQQREQDSGFSVHAHHSQQLPPPPQPTSQPPAPQFMKNPDTEFFRTAPRVPSSQGPGNPTQPPSQGVQLPGSGSIAIADLFRKARASWESQWFIEFK